MDTRESLTLLHANPERYATTGLDWGNPNHHEVIANGLFQTLMGHLARQQGYIGRPEGKTLRRQQARIEQRLSVVERAQHRRGVQLQRRMEDEVAIYGLEKMADALEEGAGAWRRAREKGGSNVLAGTMLGIAVGMAANVRGHGALERFSIGPFGGLSKIGALVTRQDLMLEMEDLSALNALVEQARRIPAGCSTSQASGPCLEFYKLYDAFLERIQKRDQGRDWTA